MGSDLFDVAVAAIFAREIIEGCIIITQFRTFVRNSPLSNDEKFVKDREIFMWAGYASALAIAITAGIGIGLAAAGKDLDKTAAEVIEGISKVIAAMCVAQISLKIPRWMGLYASNPEKDLSLLEDRNLQFNVAWNLFREIGEIGIFLIPFFLDGDQKSIWVSGLIGIGIALIVGICLELAETRMKPHTLAIFCSLLTAWLAAGLFTGGLHEFEEVYGETDQVFEISGKFFNHGRLPMATFKPFGYSHHPTELQISSFWCFAVTLAAIHYWQFRKATVISIEKKQVDDLELASPGMIKENADAVIGA